MAVTLLHEFFRNNGGLTRHGGLSERLRRLLDSLRGQVLAGGDHPPLAAALELVNQRIYDTGQTNAAHGNDRPLGTTVVMLKLAGEHAYWAHVGDSRLYRMRGGDLQLLTADHTVHGEPYRGQAVIPNDIQHTNKLLQAVGIREEIDVAAGTSRLHSGDVFLLCSDGVSGLVPPAAILELLTAGATTEEVGRRLIRLALDAGGRDNASVIVVKIGDGQDDTTLKLKRPLA